MRTRKATVGRTLAALAIAATLPAAGSLAPAAASAGTSPAALASHPVVHSCHTGRALCGSIRVPLYWNLPDGGGRRLQVRFRIYLHTDAHAKAAEPVVAFEGGPGYGSIGSAGSYLSLLGPLRATHDLIVMDQRGTGSSDAIHCPALQQGTGNFVDAVAACARKLGPAANAYGSAAVAQDLHAILSGLGISKVDVYGDSYGTYAAQAFTLHHPEDVRAVVLDGAYDNSFDPFERPAAAAMRAMWKSECAQAQLCGGILERLAKQTDAFAHHPLVGVGADRRRRAGTRSRDGSRLRAAGERRDLLVHGDARPPGCDAGARARGSRADAPPGGRPRVDGRVRRKPGGLFLGRLHGRLVPRLPDDLGRARHVRRAAHAARRGDRRPATERVRAVPESGVAALAVRAPARVRLPQVAAAGDRRSGPAVRAEARHPCPGDERRVRPVHARRTTPGWWPATGRTRHW